MLQVKKSIQIKWENGIIQTFEDKTNPEAQTFSPREGQILATAITHLQETGCCNVSVTMECSPDKQTGEALLTIFF